MAPSTHRLPSLDAIDHLADRYAFRRPDEVVQFLRQHRDLVPLLMEAAEVIPRHFGAAPLVLEVFTDPEGEEEECELFALIQTALPSGESVARLDRVDEEWRHDASGGVDGALMIDIEPV